VAKEVMPDHVHLFVRVRPTAAPPTVVQAFKGRTARVLRQEFRYLRR
jgi:putative transposase